MFKPLILPLVSIVLTASLPAEVLFSDSFSYDLPDMTTLTGDTPAGRTGIPWKTAVEQPAARILLRGTGSQQSLFMSDNRQKPREEVYAFLDRLALDPGSAVFYGVTITPANANDNRESGRLLSFSTSDKRGEGVTRARCSIWMQDGQIALGIDSDGTLVEGSRTFPVGQPIRIVVAYTHGVGSQLWAGKPGEISNDADLIAESPGRRKDPFTCFWIGIPSNSQVEIDDLVIATTWAEASSPAK